MEQLRTHCEFPPCDSCVLLLSGNPPSPWGAVDVFSHPTEWDNIDICPSHCPQCQTNVCKPTSDIHIVLSTFHIFPAWMSLIFVQVFVLGACLSWMFCLLLHVNFTVECCSYSYSFHAKQWKSVHLCRYAILVFLIEESWIFIYTYATYKLCKLIVYCTCINFMRHTVV